MLSCVWLFCNPLDYSLPGSSVHGISHSRILEWVAISSSGGSSRPRDQIHISCIGRWILYHWATFSTITQFQILLFKRPLKFKTLHSATMLHTSCPESGRWIVATMDQVALSAPLILPKPPGKGSLKEPWVLLDKWSQVDRREAQCSILQRHFLPASPWMWGWFYETPSCHVILSHNRAKKILSPCVLNTLFRIHWASEEENKTEFFF